MQPTTTAPLNFSSRPAFIQLGSSLAIVGIHGNGHMLMLEKNSMEIAEIISRWLSKSVR